MTTPVPWTKLAWVTWRQHRAALAGTAALLGGLSLYLLIFGLRINSAYAKIASCHPASSTACQQLANAFQQTYWGGGADIIQSGGAQTISGLLQAVPVLLGVFVGAPRPGPGTGHRDIPVRLDPGLRPGALDGGVDFAAWTMIAFTISAFAGAVIRRTIPAMAAAVATWIILDMATVIFLRPHYEAPLSSEGAGPGPTAWVVSQVITGRRGSGVFAYQPQSRFWTFQFIEGGWLLALAVLLGAATIWLVRRRAA
jgi:hypothetical protein